MSSFENWRHWRVTFQGHLFGFFAADVLEDCGATVRILHPLTEQECTVPKRWMVTAVPGKDWTP
jgi:hypothetical protein